MFKVGDKVKIVACLNGHKFKIGEKVTIAYIDGKDSYRAKSLDDYWWVTDDEIELVEEKQMFDINAPFTTRDGREVRILCTDGPGKWPIVGIISDNTCIDRWKPTGENENHLYNNFRDLINTPPKPIDLGWVPICGSEDDESKGWVNSSYETKQNAENESDVVRHLSFVNGKIVDDTEEIDHA